MQAPPHPGQAAPEDPYPNPAPRESCCLERSGGLPAGEVPPILFLRQMELGRRLAPLFCAVAGTSHRGFSVLL